MIYDIFRWFAIIQAWCPHWLFFKRKTYYEEGDTTPKRRRFRGGKLIISNHYGVFDFMVNLFLVLPRKLWVVASEHAYRNRLRGFGMRFFGGIECDRRTRNMRFMDKAAAILRKGGLVQIFPEGKNTDDGQIGPFYPSYIVIAHRGNAPIIPIVTDGQYGFFKRTHILVGREIDLKDYITAEGSIIPRAQLDAANEAIRGKMLALKAELDTRVAAERNTKKQRKDGK